ncbi:MAG: hypothetical protein MUF81_07625 [Verrucomicrobia bacterium]|jgi:hypothetical protein|nr:hypothetical protein [Verrucomicrobiota bacterium]
MNTTIISHRMFVAALTSDGQSPGKQPTAGRDFATNGAARNGVAEPSPETLAALAARSWVNWPFGGQFEERAVS